MRSCGTSWWRSSSTCATMPPALSPASLTISRKKLPWLYDSTVHHIRSQLQNCFLGYINISTLFQVRVHDWQHCAPHHWHSSPEANIRAGEMMMIKVQLSNTLFRLANAIPWAALSRWRPSTLQGWFGILRHRLTWWILSSSITFMADPIKYQLFSTPAELYNAVLVDTPLAPFFESCINEQVEELLSRQFVQLFASQDLDEMNIEIIRNTLYKVQSSMLSWHFLFWVKNTHFSSYVMSKLIKPVLL